MKKTEFLELTKGQYNTIRKVGTANIARVGWFDYGWLIVEDGETFKEVGERTYTPIDRFHTREDLWRTYKNII